MPDIIAFGDFDEQFVSRHVDALPRRLLSFPYPNGRSKQRVLSVADPCDLVRTRIAAGAAIPAILARRNIGAVFSGAIRSPGGPDWSIRTRGYDQMVQQALAAMRPGTGLVCTDVRQYYASVTCNNLARVLLPRDVPADALGLYCKHVLHWQRYDGLEGIPIGPEASGVFANAFLYPLDEAFIDEPYFRFMDDMFCVVPARTEGRDWLDQVDSLLGRLGLRRADSDKTRFFESRDEAEAALRRRPASGVRDQDDAHMAVGRARFEAAIEHPERSVSDFRGALKSLANDHDDYAVPLLLDDVELFALDPKATGDYLQRVAANDIAEHAVAAVEKCAAAERNQAVALHILRRIAACEELGSAEGRALQSVAENGRWHPCVRAWALHALGPCPTVFAAHATDIAMEESEDPIVRRAALLATAAPPSRASTTRGLLKSLAKTTPVLMNTIEYLDRSIA